ncbi:hypothetical protein PN499_18315 [Kamptonema animale CS-326]|nr:hypothetical protein [Kamptonema animale]MDB9513151.1 hypothetical protein [Kamptonema animale CS-326]
MIPIPAIAPTETSANGKVRSTGQQLHRFPAIAPTETSANDYPQMRGSE